MTKRRPSIPRHASYYLEKVKCQKRCCLEGASHGPYVYAQWWAKDGHHKRYVRKATEDDIVHIPENPLTAADKKRRRRRYKRA